MKKILLLLFLLFGCQQQIFLEGKYSSNLLNSQTIYEFDQDVVKVKLIVSGAIIINEAGKYQLNDEQDEITFTFPDLGESGKQFEGSFTFEEKENAIVIGTIEYDNQK